ncbi:MAG: hypothetical protein WDN09_04280 [bacterium]
MDPDMVRVLPRLAKRYTIWIVTGRERRGLDVINHVVKRQIPDSVDNVRCVRELLQDGTFKTVQKSDVVVRGLPREAKKAGFIDNSPAEILATQDDIFACLYDPLGVHDNVTGIKNRVRSWYEIGEIFLKHPHIA